MGLEALIEVIKGEKGLGNILDSNSYKNKNITNNDAK